MSIEQDIAKANAMVEKDLAKAKELQNLDQHIADLDSKIQNSRKELSEKVRVKTQSLDAEIRQNFLVAFKRPKLELEETENEIKARTAGLIYSVQFNKNGRYLYKKFDSTEKRFVFHYKHNGHISETLIWSDGKGNDVDLKKSKIVALENHLKQYVETLQIIDKEGLTIEFAQIQINPINKIPNNTIGRGKDQEIRYSKIDVKDLLGLIM
jgi:hypothetical protein